LDIQLAMLTRRQWLAICGVPFLAPRGRAQSSVDGEIKSLAAGAPLAMRFTGGTEADCKSWQQAFAAKLRELLGPFAPPAQWETIHERTVDAGDHRREQLLLRAAGHRDLPVYLLQPKAVPSGKRAGILALHGHGAFGYDAVAGIDTTPERRADIQELHYDYGVQLVRRGYMVAAPCFTPFGRRLDDPKAYRGQDPCAITFIRMQLLGRLLMSENLRDALWTLEFLAAQPNVDPARLGCVGLSTGGRMTMMTAALSPRIRVAVISGALNVMQERIGQRYSCGAQVIPGLLRYGDVPEIASLIAPRPCLWEVGLQDGLMVKEWIPPALERLQRAWRALGAPDNLDVDYFEGKHRWNGVKAYPLLARVLRP
jgi:dienelactone hydrolase